MDAATLDTAVNAVLTAACAFLLWKLVSMATAPGADKGKGKGKGGGKPPDSAQDGAVYTLEEVRSSRRACLVCASWTFALAARARAGSVRLCVPGLCGRGLYGRGLYGRGG